MTSFSNWLHQRQPGSLKRAETVTFGIRVLSCITLGPIIAFGIWALLTQFN